MKSAKEMFEELGYKLNRDDNFIDYIKINKMLNNQIRFFVKDKKVIKEDFCTGLAKYITLEELRAINKQVEELGWK